MEIQGQKIGDMLKTWVPILLSVGSIVVSYVLFRSNTEHRFEIIEIRGAEVNTRLEALRVDIDRNKTEWQRDVERRLVSIRENQLHFDFRLGAMEGRAATTPVAPRAIEAAPRPPHSLRRPSGHGVEPLGNAAASTGAGPGADAPQNGPVSGGAGGAGAPGAP